MWKCISQMMYWNTDSTELSEQFSYWKTQKSVAFSTRMQEDVLLKVWNRFQEIGDARSLPGCSHRCAMIKTTEQQLIITCRNRMHNARQLQKILLEGTRVVSRQTIRYRLHEGGLCVKKFMCIYFTSIQPCCPKKLLNIHLLNSQTGCKSGH